MKCSQLRLAMGALACALSACSADPTSDAGVGDLAISADGGAQDLAVPDQGTVDMSPLDLMAAIDADSHQPLKLIPNAVPLKVDGGVDYYELHVKPGQVQVFPGPTTTIWGFDGQWPGPTIQATLGRPVTLRVFNELPVNESITIHNHGHNVPAAYDGHPSNNTIAPSPPPFNYYDYHYPNTQAGGPPGQLQGAGTYFYHDHEQALTAPHFYKGLAGFYVIHPQTNSNEDLLNLPSGAYDIPLMIQDRNFDANNAFTYDVAFINGFQGSVLVVNGTPHPYLEVSRRKYRFRLLNASNARRLDVGLSPGSMYQIATDGGLLPARLNPSKIPLAPAERVDIVIDFSQYQIGDVATLINDDPFSPPQPEILQFRVTGDTADNSAIPGTLNTSFTPYTVASPPVTRNRSLTFDYDGTNWRMNMHIYDPAAFEFNTTQLGDVEIWTLTNSSTIPHPFHQHLIQFQILDVCPMATPACGTPPPGPQTGWKDTVLVDAATSVRIKMKFYYTGPEATHSIFPGAYVFHCHNLEHEDHQMMLQQMVLPSPSPAP